MSGGGARDPHGLVAASRLLRRGRTLHALSVVLTLAAVLLLGAAFALGGEGALRTPSTMWLLAASVVCGLVQLYYALRTGFDADLLEAVAGLDPALAAASIDAGLQALGLLPAGKAGRGWDARLRGARGLLLRQMLATLLQAALVLAGVLLA